VITFTILENPFDNLAGFAEPVPFLIDQLLDIEHHSDIPVGIAPIASGIPGRSKFSKKTFPVPEQIGWNTGDFTHLTDGVVVFS